MTRSCVSLNSFSIASSVSLLVADSAAVMLEAIRLLLAMTLPSCSTVRAAAVASSVEGSAEPRIALSWLWASIIAGAEAATNSACALRSASYCLSCRAAASSRSRAAEPRLLIMSSMFLTVSVSAATTVLSAPSSMISPSFCSASGSASPSSSWSARSAILRCARPAAPVPGWQGSRSAPTVAGWRPAAGCRVRDRSTMVPPRCPSTMAGAGADHDRHAGDHGEGGEQVAPDAPFRKAESRLSLNLPMLKS